MSISTYFRPNIHQNGPEILGVNSCDTLRQIPLYLAAANQKVDMLEVLMREGEELKVNTVTWEGITAFGHCKEI
jgi:hypothetical protein